MAFAAPLSNRSLHDDCRRRLLAGTGLCMALAAGVPAAMANPSAGTVASGTVAIDGADANNMVITQTGARAIINWSGFSIDQGQSVRFVHDNARAVTLNRVQGSDPSVIDGGLTANGRVFLINRNGILFGNNAVVDVNTLVATTANISDANFLDGIYSFDEPGGVAGAQIVNNGSITVAETGLAGLVAPSVANAGTITAKFTATRSGSVVMAGGRSFSVDLQGDGLISFEMTQGTQSVDLGASPPASLVSHTGTITADGGTILLTTAQASAIVDNAINIGGTIQADTITSRGGVIRITGGGGDVAVSGAVRARGEQAAERGGTVTMLDIDSLDLATGGVVNVTGLAGGGRVQIGTTGTDTGNAARTISLAAGSSLQANSSAGTAGQIELSATDSIIDHGALQANSARGTGGAVTLRAPTLTLGADISATDTAVNLTGNIGLTADVTITAGGGAVGFGGTVDGAQALTVNSRGVVTFTGAVGAGTALTSLTTDAVGTVQLANVTTTGNQTYGDAVVLNGTRYATGGGAFQMASSTILRADTTISTTAAPSGDGTAQRPDGNITLGLLTGNSRRLVLDNGGGTIRLSGLLGLGALGIQGGGPRILNTGTYDIGGDRPVNLGDVQLSGTVTFSQDTQLGAVTALASSVVVNNPSSRLTIGTLSAAGRNVRLTGSTGSDTTVMGTSVAGILSVDGAGKVTLAGTVTANTLSVEETAAVTLADASVTGTVSVKGGAQMAVSGALTAESLSVEETAAVTLADASMTGAVSVKGGAQMAVSGALTAKSLSVEGTGPVTLNGGGTVKEEASFTQTGDLTIGNGFTFTGGADMSGMTGISHFAGLITTHNGPLTLGRVQVTKNAQLSTGTGTITLTGDVSQGSEGLTLTLGGPLKASVINGRTIKVGVATLLAGGSVDVTGTGTLLFDQSVTLGADTAMAGAEGGISVTHKLLGAQTLTTRGGVTLTKGADIAALVAASGTLTLGGGVPATVQTTGKQTYSGTLGLDGDVTLAGSAITLAAATFTGKAADLTVDAAATIEGSNRIEVGSGDVRFTGTLSGAGGLTVESSGLSRFDGAVALGTLTTDAEGQTYIATDSIAVTGALVLGDAVTVARDLVVTAGSARFGGQVAGDADLTVNSAGTTWLTGGTDLGGLVTDAAGTTVLGGKDVKATRSIALHDAVTLAANTDVAADTIELGGTVGVLAEAGASNLALTGRTLIVIKGDVGSAAPLDSLTVTGPLILGDGTMPTRQSGGSLQVATKGAQLYGGSVRLAADTHLKAGSVRFAGTLDGDRDGIRSLVVDSGGDTLFGSNVGVTARLASLVTDAPGRTLLGSGDTMRIHSSVNTWLGDNVILSADTLLSGRGTVRIDGTVAGDGLAPRHFVVNATGQTLLAKAVGGTAGPAPASVISDAAIDDKAGRLTVTVNDATLGGMLTATTIASVGALTLNDPTVTLRGGLSSAGGAIDVKGTLDLADNGVLDAGTGSITLSGAVNGDQAGRSLSLRASTIVVTGAVGGKVPLSALTTAGRASLMDVITAGAQTYGGDVRLNGAAYRTGNGSFTVNGATTLGDAQTIGIEAGGGAVTFAGTVDGARNLVVNSSGTTIFQGAVGAGTALAALSTDAAGETHVGGGQVTTSGAQNWGDGIGLQRDVAFSGDTLTFAKPIWSAGTSSAALTVTGRTEVTFRDLIGVRNAANADATDKGQALRSLAVTAARITLAPSQSLQVAGITGTGMIIRTAGNLGDTAGRQSFTGPVTISGGRVLFDTTNGGATPSGLRGAAVDDPISPARGGDLLFNRLDAGSTDVIWYLGSGRVGAVDGSATRPEINVLSLGVAGLGGGAELTGAVAGSTGAVAAQRVVKSQPRSNSYRLNECAMGSPTCVVTGIPALSVPQAVNRPAFPDPVLLEEVDEPTISRGNEDLW